MMTLETIAKQAWLADSKAAVLEALSRVERETAGEVERLREDKDGAYNERNRLVAYLASLFPSCLERHPEEDRHWEDDWRWIVFIDHPSGQLSWHIHDSELPLFDHVERGNGSVKWDGHTTEEKYARLQSAIDSARKAQEKEQKP